MPEEQPPTQVIEILANQGPALVVLVAGLKALMNMTKAHDIAPTFSSIVGNLFGPMSEESWRSARLNAQQPCNKPQCDCHIRHAALMDAIELERESYQRGLAAIRKRT